MVLMFWFKLMVIGGVEFIWENLIGWFGVGVFCVGMGFKLFLKDKVVVEDWGYVIKKCIEVLEYIVEVRK